VNAYKGFAVSWLPEKEIRVQEKPDDLGIFRRYECALAVAEKPVGLARCFVAAGNGLDDKSSLTLLFQRRELRKVRLGFRLPTD
jgi:hypothetical protein